MQRRGLQAQSFTSRYDGKSNVLANQVGITAAFDPTEPPTQPPIMFDAVWDTGATNSVVTSNVVAQCGLKPSGMVDVHTAQGSHTTETYLVGIHLPNRVAFPSVKVSKGTIRGFDVLIGMDIIGTGDFAVTNRDGKTVFSFRIPSMECIDFVKDTQSLKPASLDRIGRNAPCPCGSGKKYKRCCGKAA